MFAVNPGTTLPLLTVEPPASPTRYAADDPLWNGMAVGAAIGGVIGLGVVPATECKPSNPECPTLLRIGVGIPAVAGGAAVER
jgi:hypothetical protein